MTSPGQARALALAVRHVNASTPETITEADLLSSIRTGRFPQRHRHHVFAFIDETDPATLTDLVLSGAASYGQSAMLAQTLLPQGHSTRTWLDDRRAL